MVGRFSLWVGICVAACGTQEPDGTDTRRVPIIGGSVSLDDVQVFALGRSPGGMFCTATLIGERTLLTAAHCLEQGANFSASNQTDVKGWPADSISAVEVRVHPKWAQGNSDYDVGLVLLDAAPLGVPQKTWNRQPLLMPDIPRVRAVGFGETHADGTGVRRQAVLEVTALSPMTLRLGNEDGASTCFGDSGGPSMHRGADGVERVAGVHAFANSAACNGGGDVRVDAIADFIDQWTRDKAPTCATDGACVMGCPELDLDCHCLTDGFCRAACPLPDTDVDCPKHCLGDGVCAFGVCGLPDPDCMVDGSLCQSAESCAGHQCLTDAQHPDAYCSRTCRAHTDCHPAMRCSFGVCKYPVLPLATMGDACVVGQTFCSGGVCGGQSEQTATCRLGCTSGGVCPGSMKCVGGVLGVSYCQGTEVLPAVAPLPAAPGDASCAAAGPELWALLAALWLLRRPGAAVTPRR